MRPTFLPRNIRNLLNWSNESMGRIGIMMTGEVHIEIGR